MKESPDISYFASVGKSVFNYAEHYSSFLTLGECFIACNDYSAAQICFKSFTSKVFGKCSGPDTLDIGEISALYRIVLKEQAETQDAVNYALMAVLTANIHAQADRIIRECTIVNASRVSSDKVGEELLYIYKNKKYSNFTELRELYAVVDKVNNKRQTNVPLFSVNTRDGYIDNERLLADILRGHITVGKQDHKGYIIAI